MSVVGQKLEQVENLFYYSTDSSVGAYCVMFYKRHSIEYVIVDDFLPVNAEGEWAFARDYNGVQIWPAIIEKAYAKLHGTYDDIVGGKAHFALADLTGGVPEEIKLRLHNMQLV